MFCNVRWRAVLLIAGFTATLTPLGAAPTLTARFAGNINGARADAALSFEKLYDYTLVAGKIESAGYTYGFTAEVVGDSGFGTMTDSSAGTRFQIKLVFFQGGFRLISNPLGPGTPTPYDFRLTK